MVTVQLMRNDKPILLQECEFLAVYIDGQIHREEKVVVSILGYDVEVSAREAALMIIEHYNRSFDRKLAEID